MSHRRRSFVLRQPVVVDIGCRCRRPKLPSFFPSPKHKRPKSPTLVSPSSSTSLCNTSLTGATASSSSSSTSLCNTSLTGATASSSSSSTTTATAMRANSSFPFPSPPFYLSGSGIKKGSDGGAESAAVRKGVVEGSTAVVKESSEPYLDFLESMLQMIVEMEIYAWDDLRDLLHCFLDLNAPHHHCFILRAFTAIWNGVFAVASPTGSPSMRRRQ